VARGPSFHDLASLDDATFDEDSMSYVRGCWYASELGWDTTEWRAAIAAILPRLNASLPRRGVHQRLSFSLLYAALGLTFEEDFDALFQKTGIATLRDFRYWVSEPGMGYDFTHEIFGGTWRGRRPLPVANVAQRRYAERATYMLMHVHLTEKNHDLVAELAMDRLYLGAAFDDQLRFAADLLLAGQNPDGSFGFHTEELIRQQKGNPKYDVKIGGNLHTTLVSLWALMAMCR
jgi:hypothetical protein